MKTVSVYDSLDTFSSLFPPLKLKTKPISLCIGNFDGMHLGHQALLKASKEWSLTHNGQSCLLSFFPDNNSLIYNDEELKDLGPSHSQVHSQTPSSLTSSLFPQQLQKFQKFQNRLFDFEDQVQILSYWEFSALLRQTFDSEYCQRSAEQFLNEDLLKKIKPSHIVVGHDFRFGKDRQGDIDLLSHFCSTQGWSLTIVPPVEKEGIRISTSLIKNFLQVGKIESAITYLGRPSYFLRGEVIRGEGRGKKIGFPTANIKPTVNFIPKLGVYSTQTWVDQIPYSSLTNIGINPTFKYFDHSAFYSTETFDSPIYSPIKIETHILHFDRNIYGKTIQVDLLSYLREEKKFSSVSELIHQIQMDILQVQKKGGSTWKEN